MKCYLHIGPEKSATTTLQEFFHLNRTRLLEKGYLFTGSAGEKNNHKLAVAAYDPGRRDEFWAYEGLETAVDLLKFQRQIMRSLSEEIRAAAVDKSGLKVIFSSEHLQSRLTEMSELYRLKQNLVDIGISSFSIIMYLRNPADIANSLYSTAVRCGGVAMAPPPPDDPYFSNVCDHRRTLERFGTVFGHDSLIPRIFDPSRFMHGSIIDDFLDVIGVPPSDSYQVPANANESLSAYGLRILRSLNVLLPKINDGRHNPMRGDLDSFFEKHFKDGKYHMSAALYDAYDDHYSESNEWVRRMFFPEIDRLFPEKTYPGGSGQDMSEEESEKIAALIADIWMAGNGDAAH